jgi:imidazolonepropionase-like amidohydrolase
VPCCMVGRLVGEISVEDDLARLEDGAAADIVALDSDPRADIGALRKVSFVMKDAKVWKGDGIVVGTV